MSVVDRFCNNLDKVDDLQEYDSPEVEVSPFNSCGRFGILRPRDRHKFIENRREYYEMRAFLRGDGRDD